jgi:hypothetical protein
MTTYRDGVAIPDYTTYATVSGAGQAYTSSMVRAVNISSMVTAVQISSMVTVVQISGMVNTTSGLGNWTSSVQTIYEFGANSWDLVSGADWAAGATVTASGAIDVSAPSITAVAMITGQGVGFGLVVPPNAGSISQRIIARHYTSGPTATFTLYHRNLAGAAWSGIMTATISGTLLYRNALTSSALANLPVTAGTLNQFDIGISCSGTVYLADYQLVFS